VWEPVAFVRCLGLITGRLFKVGVEIIVFDRPPVFIREENIGVFWERILVKRKTEKVKFRVIFPSPIADRAHVFIVKAEDINLEWRVLALLYEGVVDRGVPNDLFIKRGLVIDLFAVFCAIASLGFKIAELAVYPIFRVPSTPSFHDAWGNVRPNTGECLRPRSRHRQTT